HLSQYVFGVRRRQPFVQIETVLKCGLDLREVPRSNPRGHQDLHSVWRQCEQRAQSLKQFGVLDCSRFRIQHIFEIVEEQNNATVVKISEQRSHLLRRRNLSVLEKLLHLGAGIVGQQLREVIEKIRKSHAARSGRAQINNPIDLKSSVTFREFTSLDLLKQATNERGLPHASAANNGHQPQCIIPQEARDQARLHVPVLKI